MQTPTLPRDALGRERRAITIDDAQIETRTAADGSVGFKGFAAIFNSRTWIGSKRGGFWETVLPGAFDDSISSGADVRMLFNHNPDLPLARTVPGTLRLSATGHGLYVDADLAPTSTGRDLAISLERRDVTQMSFSWGDGVVDEWSLAADGARSRGLASVPLMDVAPVTFPAYLDTDASLRSVAFNRLCSVLNIDPDDQAALVRAAATGTAARTHTAERRAVALRGALAALNSGALLSEPQRRAVVAGLRDIATDEMTFSDITNAVEDAIESKLGIADTSMTDVWICDITDTWAVYQVYGGGEELEGLWRIIYTMADDGTVTLDGDPEQVETTYTPVPDGANSVTPESARTGAAAQPAAVFRRYAQSVVAARARDLEPA